jgi:tRNA G10  N-methylase Trm11
LNTLAVESFDVILTSPPYGDSRTTVQYGAASELCLSVIRHLKGLESLFELGSSIDSHCLGGKSRSALQIERKYWAGGRSNPSYNRVANFLEDYASAVAAMARTVRRGGRAVLVVGRRSSGGFRLKLDEFTVDMFAAHGFELEERFERDLQHKRLPTHVNRFARARDEKTREKGVVRTFDRDIVVVMRKATVGITSNVAVKSGRG